MFKTLKEHILNKEICYFISQELVVFVQFNKINIGSEAKIVFIYKCLTLPLALKFNFL